METVEGKRKKLGKYAHCAICKKQLHGVPRKNHRKLSKSEKKPNRIFGGYLCSSCSREKLKEKIRSEKIGERRVAKAISS